MHGKLNGLGRLPLVLRVVRPHTDGVVALHGRDTVGRSDCEVSAEGRQLHRLPRPLILDLDQSLGGGRVGDGGCHLRVAHGEGGWSGKRYTGCWVESGGAAERGAGGAEGRAEGRARLYAVDPSTAEPSTTYLRLGGEGDVLQSHLDIVALQQRAHAIFHRQLDSVAAENRNRRVPDLHVVVGE